MRRRERDALVHRLTDDLRDGIKGAPLYDAWTGRGQWTPTVRLTTDRDARIVALWIADEVDAAIKAERLRVRRLRAKATPTIPAGTTDHEQQETT